MDKSLCWLLLLLGVLISAAACPVYGAPSTHVLTIRSASHAFAPYTLRADVRVIPHQDNTLICVAYVGDLVESSDCRELKGIRAAILFNFTFLNLPAGVYTVMASVWRGKRRFYIQMQTITVLEGNPGDNGRPPVFR